VTLTPDPNLPPRIQFRVPRPYDRRELATLYERRTGFGLETTLDLLFDDEQPVYGLLAVDVERIVGVGVVEMFHRTGVEDYLAVDTDGYPIGDVNGVVHALAVHEEWEGRGIGTELMRLLLEIVREAPDADAAFGVAWLRPHAADSSALFESLGFDRLDTLGEYYRDSERARECPDCGRPCTCAAAIYGMELD
jgi:ribosomal protein S18 acetylase RimI-like enzyme